jgi:hypothetical protein
MGLIGDKIKKKYLKYVLITMSIYVLIYLVSWRFFFIGCPAHLYTPDWTAKHFLWIACPISCIPGFFGRYRFSLITIIGYMAGVVLGEIFSPTTKIMQEGLPSMPVHNGWLIAILTYLGFCLIMIVYEVYLKKRKG